MSMMYINKMSMMYINKMSIVSLGNRKCKYARFFANNNR